MFGWVCGWERPDEVEAQILWEESGEGLEVRSCGFCVGD